MTDRIQVAHPTGGRTLVKRAERDATDINNIVKRARAGYMPAPNAQQPRYGDFTQGSDFREALTAIRQAESNFHDLPSAVRSHCKNDPAEFLDLVFDPERRDELVALGLVEELAPEGSTPQKPDQPATGPGPSAPNTDATT